MKTLSGISFCWLTYLLSWVKEPSVRRSRTRESCRTTNEISWTMLSDWCVSDNCRKHGDSDWKSFTVKKEEVSLKHSIQERESEESWWGSFPDSRTNIQNTETGVTPQQCYIGTIGDNDCNFFCDEGTINQGLLIGSIRQLYNIHAKGIKWRRKQSRVIESNDAEEK